MAHLIRFLLTVAIGVALAAGPVKVQLQVVSHEVIRQRFETVKRTIRERRESVEALFRDAGCAALTTQPVKHSKEPNVICALPGQDETARTIVVGAHYDFAPVGDGAIDDWSGASMLSSLYQSLARHPRRHRFQFVAFAAEEEGMLGPKEYVKKLSKEERTAVAAMVNLECLGLSTPTFWAQRADKRLGAAYVAVARNLGLTPSGTNIDAVGDDDPRPFMEAKIPVISFHSVTQKTLPVLHSIDDKLTAVDATHYYEAYRLASLFLAYIDSALD